MMWRSFFIGVEPDRQDFTRMSNTSILSVLLRRLFSRANHNSPVRAQTDDLLSRYARKTVKIFRLFDMRVKSCLSGIYIKKIEMYRLHKIIA
jgi:hypothetical protein